MHPKVYAPNVHLFAFHLRTHSTSETGEKADEAHPLWQQCDRILEKLQIQNIQLASKLHLLGLESDSLRVELPRNAEDDITDLPPENIGEPLAATTPLSDRDRNGSVPFQGEVSLNDQVFQIGGFVYPLLLRDSYALALNIGYPEQENGQKIGEVDLALLGQLNPDNCLMLEMSSTYLGQTLLITVRLTEEEQQQDRESLKNLADRCLESLIPDSKQRPEFNSDGQLFGSPIFEYGLLSKLAGYRQILVWFLCDQSSAQKFEELYYQFIDLFYDRNKTIRAYQLSRNVYRQIYQYYQKIEHYINEVFQQIASGENLSHADLQACKNHLKTLPKLALEYSRMLRNLDYYRHTITSSRRNYADQLKQIQEIVSSKIERNCDTDLRFLDKFSQESQIFEEQIRADLAYFVHANGLLDKAIAAIRGIVEIEQVSAQRQWQALIQSQVDTQQQHQQELQKTLRWNNTFQKQRDRTLQTIILVLGTAFGIGAIVASKPDISLLVLIILAIGIAGTLAWWFAQQHHRRLDKPAKRQGLANGGRKNE